MTLGGHMAAEISPLECLVRSQEAFSKKGI